MKQLLNALLVGFTALAALGCGAPTKSASEVKAIFEKDAVSLQDKVSSLCKKLETRERKPNLYGVDLPVDGCKEAGLAAANLKDVKEFTFIGLDDTAAKSNDEIINRFVRGELWLNRTLIGMAGAIGQRMKAMQESGDNKGFISLPDSEDTSALGDLVSPDIEVLEEPEFDLSAFSFSTAVRLTVTGAVEVDHTIRVNGGLIDNKFVLVISTDGQQPFEKSLLRDFSALVLIVPHASDIYLDMYVNLNIHNVGFKGLVKDNITKFLGSSLKSIIDGLSTL